MSTTTVPANEEEGQEDIRGLVQALQALTGTLEERIENLEKADREKTSQINDLERALEERDERIAELEARTDMLQLVEDADSLDGQQRSTALIQHLKNAAEKKQKRGSKPHASVNRKQAEEALHHPDVDRTTIYDDMKRAVRMVNDKDILEYESQSGGGSRLKLKLENGSLPAAVEASTNRSGR